MALYSFVVGPVWTEAHSGNDTLIDRLLAIPDPRAADDKSFLEGLWDGRVHFFDREQLRLPSGLFPRLRARLENRGHEVSWTYAPGSSRQAVEPVPRDCLQGVDLRDHQLEGANLSLAEMFGLLWHATNSGKTEIMAAIISRLVRDAGLRVLVIVPTKVILHEVVGRLRKRLGEDVRIGALGDGIRQLKRPVTVAMYQSLQQALPAKLAYDPKLRGHKVTRRHDKAVLELVRTVGAVLVDEAHHASASVYQEVLKLAESAWYRLGFTGTVSKRTRRTDADAVARSQDSARLAQWQVEQFLGPVLQRIENDYLIEKGYSARPRIFMVVDRAAYGGLVPTQTYRRSPKSGKLVETTDLYGATFAKAAVEDQRWVKTVVRVMRHLIAAGKPPFVFSHSIAHLRAILAIAEARGVPCKMLYGDDDTRRRDDVLAEFAAGQDFAVLTSTIFDEGANVPEIRAVVFAGARKSIRETLQRLGRGIRAKKDDNTVVLVDFMPLHCSMLLEHAKERLAVYETEGFEIREVRDVTRLSEVDF